MLRVKADAVTWASEAGLLHGAVDLSGSEAEYLVISVPISADAAAEFFGHDHYVEVKDQRYGRYGGLRALSVGSVDLTILLAEPVPGVGDQLSIRTEAAIPAEVRAALERLHLPSA